MVVVHGDGRHLLSSERGKTTVEPLRPGDVILVRPRDRHTIIGPVQFYNIAFPATGWRAFEGLAKVDPVWDLAPVPPHERLPAEDARAVQACAVGLHPFHHTPGEPDLI